MERDTAMRSAFAETHEERCYETDEDVAAPRRTSHLDDALRRVDDALERLDSQSARAERLVARLEQVLEPALMPEPPRPHDVDEAVQPLDQPPTPLTSAIVQRSHGIEYRTDYLARTLDRMTHLLDRVDL